MVLRPWYVGWMQTIAISKFKARCLAILEEVRRTGEPVRVTRFGKPVAEIFPPAPSEDEGEWMGRWRGEMRIVGDVVSPVIPPETWEAFGDPADRFLAATAAERKLTLVTADRQLLSCAEISPLPA